MKKIFNLLLNLFQNQLRSYPSTMLRTSGLATAQSLVVALRLAQQNHTSDNKLNFKRNLLLSLICLIFITHNIVRGECDVVCNKNGAPKHSEGILGNQKPIVIVVASYNNKNWVDKNIRSILSQNYSNYRVIYVNDCSTDETGELVEKLVKELGQEHRFTLINNDKNAGNPLANHYKAIHMCEPQEIVALVDGDDWLPDELTLQRLNKVYCEKDVWVTYGQFKTFPYGVYGWCVPMPEDVIRNNSIRQFRDMPSHLKTFYAGLFHKIKLEDLLHEGNFFAMTGDQALIFPIMEMAGERHYCFDEVMYIYNDANPISEHRRNNWLQKYLSSIIRAKTPYARLEKLDFMEQASTRKVACQQELYFSFFKSDQLDHLAPDFLSLLVETFGVDTFVETGTYLGDTSALASNYFKEVHTIELAPHLYNDAKRRFNNNPAIHVYLGDSVEVFPTLIPQLKGNICFFLDGHFSQGVTAKGEHGNTPIIKELEIIKESGINNSLILIDDIRCFKKLDLETSGDPSLTDYPTVAFICDLIKSINKDYKIVIFGDVLIAWTNNNNITVSPFLEAFTVIRAFDGTNYSLHELENAYQQVCKATEEEKLAMQKLFHILGHCISFGVGEHLWVANALFAIQEGDKNSAKELFNSAIKYLPEQKDIIQKYLK